ncbi:MAG TPA: family 16 glycosylhydrolase, partial [Anaerolineales bacterium]|nr:family 16 glycosylhydrolase [Anaerolineales bacterium]
MKSKHRVFPIILVLSLLLSALVSPFAFSTPALAAGPLVIFDDMEHGDPGNNGWFAFPGAVGGGGIGPNAVDLPPINGGAFSVETGWGSGGVPGYFGGFGRTNLLDLSGTDHFNFWINPNAGQDYTLEINLQEDDNGDDAISQPDDDEFQFNCVVSPTGPCAVSGGGWQLVSIPLTDFYDDGSYLWGGNGVLDPVSTGNGGNGQLINVVVAVIGNAGSDVNFRTDYWAFSDGPTAFLLVDDFENGVNPGTPCVGIPLGFCTFQDASSAVAVSSQNSPPAPVPSISGPNNVLQIDLDVTAYAGFIHGFTNEVGDTWTPQDWSAYGGFGVWIYGTGSNTVMFIDIIENRNPDSTTDDGERWTVEFTDDFIGWQKFEFPFADFVRKGVGNGAPNDGYTGDEVHGWAFGTLGTGGPITYYLDQAYLFGEAAERPLEVQFSAVKFEAVEGAEALIGVKLTRPLKDGDPDQVSVSYTTEPGLAEPDRDYTPVSGTLTFYKDDVSAQTFAVPTFDNNKHDGDKTVILRLFDPVDVPLGTQAQSWLDILDDEAYDPQLIEDFETFPYLWEVDNKANYTNLDIAAGDAFALPGQGAYEHVFESSQKYGAGSYQFSRAFAATQDWSASSGINFWYYGRNNDEDVVVSLSNDQAGYTDPSKWKLVWSDEFDTAAGTAADSAVWGQDIGDGTVVGNPGWGNSELQYYTAGNANAATDGMGNLQITAKESDGSLMCYYGSCQYTSARLLTKDRFEVAYGRVEARIKVMEGAGLWPAFWMLGTDIDEVDWPQSGEIDIMEYVGRVPNEIFGTIHGPGYSGGASYGQSVDLGTAVADEFHTYAIEWQPDQITWFLDGEAYFTATPSDPYMADKQWVFNHPFFILLNVAVGGNFGGPVGEDTTFPQSMLVDYVRLYQAKDKPVNFKASFSENYSGWQKINLPFESFTNDDGYVLDTAAIESIGFKIPGGSNMPVMLDQIRLSCPFEGTVTNTNDSGGGSLRAVYGAVCADGLVEFAPELAGQTINLTTGPLTLNKNMTIDASAAQGLTVSGGGVDRVFIVDPGTTATVKNLTIADGYGWQLAGGVLNNGSLTLDHVVVTGNTMATDAGDFWQGGGGIYSGDGATLNLIDSTVSNNYADWSGGGVYSFFNTTTTIVRSTISGNMSGDVGGGIRSLGNATITNSTISGNQSTGWYGGAIFVTDGVVDMTNVTIADNISPAWAAADVFVGTFTDASATLNLTNTIVSSAQ